MREKIVDCHFHLTLTRKMSRFQNVAETLTVLRACDLDAICIQNITLWQPENLIRNPLSLYAKLQSPRRVFSFCGIRYPQPDTASKEFNYAEQARRLITMGFDGVKLFGKPTVRQAFSEPFDSPVFDEMFAYLEKEQVPILYHIGDPREFWDIKRAPAFAVDNGWIYTRPSFDEYYEEIDRLLEKRPNLRILFPHFFFLSDDLEKLRSILIRCPNVWLDITPGSEMYHNFSLHPDSARSFFMEFQDRILFGTDNTGTASDERRDFEADARSRIQTMKDFLSSGAASGWGETFVGLHLPLQVCNRIWHDNFFRFVDKTFPTRVDVSSAVAYTKEMSDLAAQSHIPALDKEFQLLADAFSQRRSL